MDSTRRFSHDDRNDDTEVFADIFDHDDDVGPTRVLTPPSSGGSVPDSQRWSNQSPGEISATRPRRIVQDPTEPLPPQQPVQQPAAPKTPAQQPVQQSFQQAPAQRQTPKMQVSYHQQPAAEAPAGSGKNLARIQFFPALLGWLVTYSLLSMSKYALTGISSLFGFESFDSFQEAFDRVVHPVQGSGSGFWAWLVLVALFLFFSFGAGGYAAARMTRLAPIKQGLGVWLWHVLAIIFSTVLALTIASHLASGVPQLSLQSLFARGVVTDLPGVLVLFLLGLLGSICGAALGPRYHRKNSF